MPGRKRFLSYSFPQDELSFRVGSTDSGHGGQTFTAAKLVVHEKYTGSWDYDIAVVKLNKPIKFGKNAKPIKLGSKSLKAATKAVIAGWGPSSQSDCGAPLVYKKAVYGLYAGSYNCLSDPALYVDVPVFVDWVKWAMKQ
ncbi:serine-type endopeptidase activity protein [Homalodisca vitripennis]|nr:serine-type endopeptidase activity protein [Homalodisca vitripennis]